MCGNELGDNHLSSITIVICESRTRTSHLFGNGPLICLITTCVLLNNWSIVSQQHFWNSSFNLGKLTPTLGYIRSRIPLTTLSSRRIIREWWPDWNVLSFKTRELRNLVSPTIRIVNKEKTVSWLTLVCTKLCETETDLLLHFVFWLKLSKISQVFIRFDEYDHLPYVQIVPAVVATLMCRHRDTFVLKLSGLSLKCWSMFLHRLALSWFQTCTRITYYLYWFWWQCCRRWWSC